MEKREYTISENLERLAAISDHDGVRYGRLRALDRAAGAYTEEIDAGLGGYEALADTFKCFFLETIEVSNSLGLTRTACISEFYTWVVPRVVVHFGKLCAAEAVARGGYPLPGYEILRNALDSVIRVPSAHVHDGWRGPGLSWPW